MPRQPRLSAELLAAVALTLLAVATRWPLAPLRGLDSDVMGPTLGALGLLVTGDLFSGGDAIFGYGRELSWVPLVAGADSLVEVARRRVLLQALVVPLVFGATLLLLGARRERPGALLGAVTAAGIVAWSEDLWRVILGQYQSYLGVEWGALLVLGLALLPRADRWRWAGAALAGVSLPMMAFHVPHAAAAAVVVPVLWWVLPGARRPVAALVGVAAIVALPHVLRLLAPDLGGIEGEGQSLLGRFRQVGNHPDVGPLAAVGVYLEAALQGPKVLLLAGPPALLLLARGDDGRGERALAWVAVAVVPLGAALVVIAQHGLPWHWLPLLPATAVCAGLVVARLGERGGGALALVLLGALVARAESGRDHHLRWPPDTLLTTAQADRVAELLFPLFAGSRVLGYQTETQLARRGEPSLVPAFVSGWMAGRVDDDDDDGPVAIYLEAPRSWLDATAAEGWPDGVRLLASGTHFVVLESRDAAAARALGPLVCRDGEPVRPIAAPDVGLLPGEHPRPHPPGLHRCALDGSTPKGPPVRQGALPSD